MTKEEILESNIFKVGCNLSHKTLFLTSGCGIIFASMEEYASQQSAALESENKRLHDVLKELVALKDWRIDFGETSKEEYLAFKQREESAWDAARKLVKQ